MPSDPSLLADVIRKQAPAAKRVVFETGSLSVWFYHALTAMGFPAICIDARHAKAALDLKTFGLVVPKGGGLVFETNVRNLLGNNALPGTDHPALA